VEKEKEEEKYEDMKEHESSPEKAGVDNEKTSHVEERGESPSENSHNVVDDGNIFDDLNDKVEEDYLDIQILVNEKDTGNLSVEDLENDLLNRLQTFIERWQSSYGNDEIIDCCMEAFDSGKF